MERDSKRRNSILKSVSITYSTIDYEEETRDQREFYKINQKSLKKRVSFAGKAEIKEFNKTEALLSVATIANNLLGGGNDCNIEQNQTEYASTVVQENLTMNTTLQRSPENQENEPPVISHHVEEPPKPKQPTEPSKPAISENACITSSTILNSMFIQPIKISWNVSFVERRTTLKCESRLLTLSFKLGKPFSYSNEEHYLIDDMDVDFSKDTSAKWARFGFSLLENTLENNFKKLPEPSTVDLKSFLDEAEQSYRSFVEFLALDAVGLELLADPRSLKLDTELHRISFDICNLENLQMIHADLFLRGVYPLSLSQVKLANKIGSINIKEATTMLTNIRPCTTFLTQAAQCLSDLLKFKPCT